MGGAEAALKVADEALAIAPDAPGMQYMKGWVLDALRDFAGARAAYEKALAENPKNIQALAGIAAAAAQLGDTAAARRYAQEALALAPGQPTATLALAKAQIEEGDGAGEALLRQLLQIRDRLPQAARMLGLGLLGDALEAQDRIDDAFRTFAEKARELRNTNRPGICTGPQRPSPPSPIGWLRWMPPGGCHRLRPHRRMRRAPTSS